MSLGLSCLRILVVFAHLTESRDIFHRAFNDEPLILDDKESEEGIPQTNHPIISSNISILQYGWHVYHIDNYEDLRELRSKLKTKPVSYDYFGEFIRSSIEVKHGKSSYINGFVVLSDTPENLCFEGQCNDQRKYNKKYKNNDDTEWKHKIEQMPLGHVKRFKIVDNRHNLVRDPKFGSEENHGKKKGSSSHKRKDSSASDESEDSEDSGSVEAKSEMSYEKEEAVKSEEIQIKSEEGLTENSSKNYDIDSKSEEEIPKKKSKKKKIESTDNTKRKTIPVGDTYFMQGNKIFHSSGKNKKKHDPDGRRGRLEHFMPKRYHWDPSEIHDLGYYWFNGPKGMYPEPKVLPD